MRGLGNVPRVVKRAIDHCRRKKPCTISEGTCLLRKHSKSPRAMFGCIEKSDRIKRKESDIDSFTGQGTSPSSSSWSRERHVWHVRKPHEHPHWSSLNTRGTCMHQSSCGSPHPAELCQFVF